MKYFSHDTNARTNRKLRKVLRTHGCTGYAIWWALLEELYSADEEGFQIKADELWLETLAESLCISDHRTLTRVFDTFAEVDLISSQLWAEHYIHVSGIIERADEYTKKKAQNAKRQATFRNKLKENAKRDEGISNALRNAQNEEITSSYTDPYSDPKTEKEIKENAPLAGLDFPDEMVDPLVKSTMPARPLPTVEHLPGFSNLQFMEFFQYVIPPKAQNRQGFDASKKKFMSVQGVDYKTFKECYIKFVKAYEAKNPNEKKGEEYKYLKGLPRWIDEEGWLEFIPEHLRGGSLNLEMVIAGLPRSFKRETYMILPDGDWRVNASLCSPEELAAFSRGSYKPESYRRIREFELPAFLEQNPGVIHLKDVLATYG